MGLLTDLRASISRVTSSLFAGSEPKRIGIYGPPNAGKCLAAGETVTLADGTHRRIEEVFESVRAAGARDVAAAPDETWLECDDRGLRVPALTEDLAVEPARVTHAFRQRYAGEMYRVRTRHGREVTVSPEHPFVGLTGDGVEHVPAAELAAGARVALCSSFAPETDRPPVDVPPVASDGGTTVRSPPDPSVVGDGPAGTDDVGPGAVRPSDPGAAIDPGTARFLGLAVAGSDPGAGDGEPNGLALATSDPTLREEFRTLAGRLRLDTTTEDRAAGPPVVRARSGPSSSGDRFDWSPAAPPDRRVPPAVLTADDRTARAFLRGVFDRAGRVRGIGSDGDDSDDGDDRGRLTLASRGRDLLVGVQTLLVRFGIVGAIRRGGASGEGGDDQDHDHEFVVTGPDRHRAFRTHVGFGLDRKARRLDALAPPGRESAAAPAGSAADVVWDRVVDVETVAYDGYIYDLTVADHHTFTTGDGLIVHNTTLANRIARDWTGDAVGPESQIPHETRRARRKENVEIKRNGKSVTIDIVDTPGVATKVDYTEFLEHDIEEDDAVRRSREATEGVAEAMHWLREDVDGVVYVLDAAEDPFTQVNTMLIGIIESQDLPVLIFANKIDLEEASAQRIRNAFPQHETVPLSALEGDNMDEVYDKIAEYFG